MIKFYNTLHHRLEEFKPLKKTWVGLYTCGPTVYNFAHLGNLRTYVFEDILKRTLVYNGFKVKHVMNITDVGHLTSDSDEGEDKIEKGAIRENKSAWEIAEFYGNAFRHDMEALNILPANHYPRATEHIAEQIKLIKKLEKKGYTYQTMDGIYFDTSRLTNYGELANLKQQELRPGARVDVGDKKNITDFALWKFSLPLIKRQMEWQSPWGVGFPGWHIECSAMAEKYLGVPFDIHCGGIDHVSVHHTNEIAQSKAANNKPLANYWLHGEFLLTGEGKQTKMAKSGDNFITLKAAANRHISPLAYRYWLLQTHYRQQLKFSWSALKSAESGLNHLYRIIRALGPAKSKTGCPEYEQDFLALINDDLNIPGALALTWKLIKSKHPNPAKKETLLKFDKIFGLKLKEAGEAKPAGLPKMVQRLIMERNNARANSNWVRSDKLRKELEKIGYQVEDTKEGTKVIKR